MTRIAGLLFTFKYTFFFSNENKTNEMASLTEGLCFVYDFLPNVLHFMRSQEHRIVLSSEKFKIFAFPICCPQDMCNHMWKWNYEIYHLFSV